MAVRALARRQFDVVTRSQLLALGATSTWISHRVESGRWRRLFPGTYVVHTGPPTWRTRAVAALGYTGAGAALSHASAGHVHRLVTDPPRLIEVSVAHDRRVERQRGLRVIRRRSMPPSSGHPSATDPVHTVLDLFAASRGPDDAVGILCAAARLGISPRLILTAAGTRSRLPQRRLLNDVLADVADGVESPLERRYRRTVEVRHGLPRASLQVQERVAGRWIRADAVYDGFGVRSELDGALAHPEGRTDADTWRDNAVLLERGDVTLRYRWRHVAVTPCHVAAQVEAALRAGGWRGRGRPCRRGCPVGPEPASTPRTGDDPARYP